MRNDPPEPGGARGPGARRRARAVLAVACAGALLAGCGASPRYQYVANSERTIVVRLPASWKSVKPSALGLTSSNKQWIGLYDGSGQGDPGNFDTKLPISPPNDPVVEMVSIKRQTKGEVPTEVLRDFLTPNSPHELTKFLRQAALDDAPLVGYDVLKETPVDTATATGLRISSTYTFDVGIMLLKSVNDPVTQQPLTVQVDKIAVADKAGKYVHVIQVWCSQECFQANTKVIDEIMTSYTVKANP